MDKIFFPSKNLKLKKALPVLYTGGKKLHFSGVTIMELMIVVVLVGVIAGFALPNYSKSLQKAHERDAIAQLTALHAANTLYFSQSNPGEYLPGINLNLNAINTGLGINIIANELTYTYSRTAAMLDKYTATATFGTTFIIRINEREIWGTNPCCSGGTCLSLAACPP